MVEPELEFDHVNAHSFVLRFWLEESASEVSGTLWRGHITHVMSRVRRHIEDLDEIKAFVELYLQHRYTSRNRES